MGNSKSDTPSKAKPKMKNFIVQIINEFDFYDFDTYEEAKQFYDKQVAGGESECALTKLLESNTLI